MSDRTKVSVLRGLAAAGGVAGLVGAALIIFLTEAGFDVLLTEGGAFALFAIFFAALVWRAAATEPDNAVVWIMTATALFGGLYILAWFVAWALSPQPLATELVIAAGELAPADIPPAAAWVVLLVTPMTSAAIVTLMTFGLLLFPDGKLPSPRWRWVAIVGGVAVVALLLDSVWVARPSSTTLYGANETLGEIAIAVILVVAILSITALLGRFRRGAGTERQQIKWVLWGGTILVLALVLLIIFEDTASLEVLLAVFAISALVFVVSYGVAVAKYRLYDVDVVISRTFVFGSLAIFIGAVYVGIVVGVSALFGSEDEPNVWLGIGATVVIAILFQPFRRQLERVANRMVYGRRSTPYEVLSSFSQNVAAVDPDVLEEVARSLTEGTTATAAGILVVRGEELHSIASWPEDGPSRGDVEADITHEGERLGAIHLTLPTGQTLLPSDQALLDQVSSGLGLALRNLQLTDDLRTRVEQLRESRRRIVSVQDQTRQKLERDLHDGAQQRLVALKIKIGISESMAQNAGLEDVAQVLATVKDDADMTIDSLRTLARGIYPPLLEAEGLGPALTTQLHRQPIPVTVQAAGVGRHPREIEATVYFCVLEAVQNSIRHAQAQSVLVTLTESNGDLVFAVRDDGIGFEPSNVGKGPGLTNMGDRVDALSGTLQIDTAPGAGTHITGTVPVREGALA